jgi:4-hydroxybenzoate polyprenyltransferase
MDIYFYSCLAALVFFILSLRKSKEKHEFLKLHNLLKVLIVLGVFCILLIKPSVFFKF